MSVLSVKCREAHLALVKFTISRWCRSLYGVLFFLSGVTLGHRMLSPTKASPLDVGVELSGQPSCDL